MLKTRRRVGDTQNKGAQGEIQNEKRRGPRKAVWKRLTLECKVNQGNESEEKAGKGNKIKGTVADITRAENKI